MIEITQPTPRNIGFTIAHISKPIKVARIIPITLAIFFNAVWAGEGVKLEFLICLLFSVIKRYFFNAYNRSLKFVRSMNSPRDGSKGMFATWQKKYELTAGKSGDFFYRMAKNIPFRHVHRHERTHFQTQLIISMKVERATPVRWHWMTDILKWNSPLKSWNCLVRAIMPPTKFRMKKLLRRIALPNPGKASLCV